MQTRISGGSSDTDVNEFAVKPRGEPSGWIVVTTVTPVTNAPSARRTSAMSKACSGVGSFISFSKERSMRGGSVREDREEPFVHARRIGDVHHVAFVRDDLG